MPADLSGFRAYASERGYPAPALASDLDAGIALIRALDYITTEYVSNFSAACSFSDPVVDIAIYEAALAELSPTGELASTSFWNSIYTPNAQKVLTEVKGIKWTLVGDPGDKRSVPVSGRIESLLGHCIIRGNSAGFGIWAIN